MGFQAIISLNKKIIRGNVCRFSYSEISWHGSDYPSFEGNFDSLVVLSPGLSKYLDEVTSMQWLISFILKSLTE